MEFQQKHAIYLQIANHICEKILSNEWNTGDKIPSIREMAVNIEVNPNTIVRAYNYLEEKNIITKTRGVGYFVSNDALKTTRGLKKQSFLSQELPLLFKTMDLLNVDLSELQQLYHQFKQENNV